MCSLTPVSFNRVPNSYLCWKKHPSIVRAAPNSIYFILKIAILFIADFCPANGRLQHVAFSGKVKDHILEGFIDSTKQVSSDENCQLLCILNGKCNLFNLADQDSSLHSSCQILRFGDLYTVKRKKGWSFRARKVFCLLFFFKIWKNPFVSNFWVRKIRLLSPWNTRTPQHFFTPQFNVGSYNYNS